jgi:hypothetical protein
MVNIPASLAPNTPNSVKHDSAIHETSTELFTRVIKLNRLLWRLLALNVNIHSFLSLSEHVKYIYHHIELHIFLLRGCPRVNNIHVTLTREAMYV